MRILHVFRTPVGGLFRHVRDLARGQRARGHDVGILCDSTTGGEAAASLIAGAEQDCTLGIRRIPISRLPGLGDISGTLQTLSHVRQLKPDIVHCHGAKGGVYGRLAARFAGAPSVYTPHGGSLHYKWTSLSGAAFLGAEWLLARIGNGFHFVCNYERQEFDAKIGIGNKPFFVIYNGLWPEEFDTAVPKADAADVLYIGELRDLKGVDVLIESLRLVSDERPVTAVLVGDGPDGETYRNLIASRRLADSISLAGRMAAGDAFRLGRILVMPSRAESLPYVVLETCAAGVPIIASRLGGIPEILPDAQLVPPGDPQTLARCIISALDDPRRLAQTAQTNRERVRRDFTADAMVESCLALYARLSG